MKPAPFELTPEQKDFLQSLSQETGKDVRTLMDEALDALREKQPVHRRMESWTHAALKAATEEGLNSGPAVPFVVDDFLAGCRDTYQQRRSGKHT